MDERKKERQREKEGRQGGGGRQERKSLENSLFKFIKVTDSGNKNSDRILLGGAEGVDIESHLNPYPSQQKVNKEYI